MTLLHHTLDSNLYTVHCPDYISIEDLMVCFHGYLPENLCFIANSGVVDPDIDRLEAGGG